MPLKFVDEAEAVQKFGETLGNFVLNNSLEKIYSKGETEEALKDVEVWSRKSRTARDIFFFHRTQGSKPIYVVGMKGGYQAFASTEGAKQDCAVIYIDLDAKLTFPVRQPHNLHFDSEKFKECIDPAKAKAANVLCTSVESVSNNIALLHELGHAKQWVERPRMFDGDYRAKGSGFQSALRTHAAAVLSGNMRKTPSASPPAPKGQIAAFDPTGLLPYTTLEEITGQVAAFPSQDDLESLSKLVWPPHLELDNMARHEWPVCRELGLPVRSNYGDILAKTDAAPTTSTLLQRAAAEVAKKQKKEDAAAELKDLPKNACPVCKQVFPSAVKLGQHRRESANKRGPCAPV